MESRTQGSRPRPRTQKKIRGQGQGQPFRGQTLSRPRTGMGPRTQAQVFSKNKGLLKNFSGDLQKKKKKGLQKIFQAISTKNRFLKNFSSAPQIFNNSKNTAVLEPRTGQFSRTWGLEAKAKDLTFEAKAKDFKKCPRRRPRGQKRPRGLHLWYTCSNFEIARRIKLYTSLLQVEKKCNTRCEKILSGWYQYFLGR